MRGQLIFFSDGTRCRHCHHVDNPQQSLGPTLAEINKKYPQREPFLLQILQPSLKNEDRYATRVVLTNDGQLLTGLLESESPSEVVLKTLEKKKVAIARDDIDEIQISSRSLMPEFLLSDLTAQEAADLLAYLISLGTDPAGTDHP